MSMTLFTQAYKKAREIFETQKFAGGDPDWEKFLKNDVASLSILANGGPNPAHADGCDKLRKKLSDSLPTGMFGRLFTHEGDIIWQAAGSDNGGKQIERAAAIKFLRHLYRADKRGGQDVWAFNPPKAHKKFVFDEVKGFAILNKHKLGQADEIYSDDEMRHMCSALALALASSQKAQMKVNSPDDTVRACVKDWFCDDHSSDTQLNTAMSKLKAGLPKIVNACNSNSLVFSDDPTSRKSRAKTYGLALPGGEGGGFPVIYLEGLFTRMTGNSGKLWLCAETIIHELTHTELSTKDVFYDCEGLKPSGNRFSSADALSNADSWGYFVMDIDGKLSAADKKRILVTP